MVLERALDMAFGMSRMGLESVRWSIDQAGKDARLRSWVAKGISLGAGTL